MKIKIILQHFNRRRDINGNVYWFHKATNTNTGRSLYWESPHYSNAASSVRRAGYDWQEICDCGSKQMMAKEFDSRVKQLREFNGMLYDSCKDEAVVKAISNLRRKKA